MSELERMVTELQRAAPRLQKYQPMDPTWQQAEEKIRSIRQELCTLLSTTEGIQKLRASKSLEEMKRLVPECARDEISVLPIADFVLGMMFVEPYIAFEQVYRGYSAEYGKELSKEARESSNNIKSSYTYGEILFFPFAEVLRSIAPLLPPHAIFYDLGSGTGKAVIAASLIHPFDQAIGLEFLQPLVKFAEKRMAVFNKSFNPHQVDLDMICGDLLTTSSWASDGDVVFCHGTCFNDKEWHQISLMAEMMKHGAYFLSTSHILHSALFDVIKSIPFCMSWGTATLYIHQRRRLGRWASQMLRGGRATRSDLQSDKKEHEVRR